MGHKSSGDRNTRRRTRKLRINACERTENALKSFYSSRLRSDNLVRCPLLHDTSTGHHNDAIVVEQSFESVRYTNHSAVFEGGMYYGLNVLIGDLVALGGRLVEDHYLQSVHFSCDELLHTEFGLFKPQEANPMEYLNKKP